MNFNNPHWFWWLIPVVLLVLILAVIAGKRKKAQLKMLLGAAADDPDAVRLSKGIRKFRLFLLLLTVFFLLAAASRPYWTSRMIPFSQQGRDIMVLFDEKKVCLLLILPPRVWTMRVSC